MSQTRPASLGPTVGRWRPGSYTELEEAAAGGLLDESHWVELKGDLPAGNPGANAELARDLASLAPDGGLLVVGVKDAVREPGAVVGVQLSKLADRIDAVARTRIDRPLTVRTRELHDPDRPGFGCLLVEVPASPLAPHMAEGSYWGRSDRAKIRLDDAQVRRLHEQLQQQHIDIDAALDALRADDPISAEARGLSHLYVVVHPVTANATALDPLLDADDGHARLLTLAKAAAGRVPASPKGFSPDLRSPTQWRGHADGRLLTTRYERLGETESVREASLVDLVIRSDGGLALTCGRGTDVVRPRWRPINGEDPEETMVVLPQILLGLTCGTAQLAGLLADEVSGYQGSWQVGVLIDRLRGVVPHEAVQHHGDIGQAFNRDEYSRATITTTDELVNGPAAVAERATKPLLVALGIERLHLPYGSDREPAADEA